MGCAAACRASKRFHSLEFRKLPSQCRSSTVAGIRRFTEQAQSMKAVLQLLKEFWVPLAIGIAWTSYNVLQMPRENWKVATFVNLFAPTFFFASWLVAQWYRVRKQQRVEDSLAGLGARIDSSSFPVLPFALIIVSRHTSTPEMLQAVFGSHPKYEVLSGKPPLLGVSFSPDLMLWNWAGKVAKERHCTIGQTELPKLVEMTREADETPIKLPVRLCVEFFFPRNEGASLIFRARDTWSDNTLTRLELFDDLVYQQYAFREWDIDNHTRRAWSVVDLRGARIRVVFKFFFFDPLNIERPPYMNDLQFCFGRQPINTLFLKTAQLEAQKWFEDDEDQGINALNEHCKSMSLAIDFQVTDKLYHDQVVQVTSAE
jgi:hypothetical protein